MRGIKHKWRLLLLTSAIGFFIDWGTKYLAVSLLGMGAPKRIIGHYLEFVLVYNKAAVFGLDPRHLLPGFPLNAFFLVFSVIAIVALITYYRHVDTNDRLTLWGLALIMPGALGNCADRIIYPGRGVVDFIKMGVSETLYWPIYNFADIYITFGIALLLIRFMVEERAGRKQETASPEPGQ